MIEINEEMAGRVNGALDQLNTLTVAYVDTAGKPHISFYGSTHVHSSDQLAIWVRNPEGELLNTIADRPEVALIFGDIKNRVYYMFDGRARRDDDLAVRNKVYDTMHPIERKFDADKKGVAVIIDLEKVRTMTAEGKTEMVR